MQYALSAALENVRLSLGVVPPGGTRDALHLVLNLFGHLAEQVLHPSLLAALEQERRECEQILERLADEACVVEELITTATRLRRPAPSPMRKAARRPRKKTGMPGVVNLPIREWKKQL